MSLLDIKNLSVRFGDTTAVPVVDGLDLSVDKGEVLAIVGESGSGKSVTMMALMGLIDAPGWVSADHLRFDGHDMLTLKGRQRRRIVGKDMAMVFQDPMTALNPSYTVGYQIEEVLRLHLGLRGKALRQRALELLERVEIPAAASRLDAYPHQLSGGMSQRVAIAMAIAAEPKLLIADEPTTALDVVLIEELADFAATEIDGLAPGRLPVVAEERGGVLREVVAVRPEVVVDHVDEDHQAHAVSAVDQMLELLGRAVGRRRGSAPTC